MSGIQHDANGLVYRLRALADDDRYAWNEWSEDVLRQSADEIERLEKLHGIAKEIRAMLPPSLDCYELPHAVRLSLPNV